MAHHSHVISTLVTTEKQALTCSPPRKMKNVFAKNENPPQRWFYQTW
ncbi:hypothetical protein [Aeromonas veronii]|nr:hypothetical protein [Aeromonas veronii]